jgi:hypothetical protein
VNARHWSDDKVLEGRAFFRGEQNPGRLVLDSVNAADRYGILLFSRLLCCQHRRPVRNIPYISLSSCKTPEAGPVYTNHILIPSLQHANDNTKVFDELLSIRALFFILLSNLKTMLNQISDSLYCILHKKSSFVLF